LTAVLGILLHVCVSIACVDSLLTSKVTQVANGVIASHNTLADIFESIEHFVNCLEIYTQITPMYELDEIVVKLMVELITTLVLTTEKLRKRQSRESFLADVSSYSA
jgi:hypothetical protein